MRFTLARSVGYQILFLLTRDKATAYCLNRTPVIDGKILGVLSKVKIEPDQVRIAAELDFRGCPVPEGADARSGEIRAGL